MSLRAQGTIGFLVPVIDGGYGKKLVLPPREASLLEELMRCRDAGSCLDSSDAPSPSARCSDDPISVSDISDISEETRRGRKTCLDLGLGIFGMWVGFSRQTNGAWQRLPRAFHLDKKHSHSATIHRGELGKRTQFIGYGGARRTVFYYYDYYYY